MIDFNKQDLLKLAKLSALKLDEQELEIFTKQVKEILSYVQELNSIDIKEQAEPVKNINLFREDKAIQINSQNIINQAPKKHDNYFVVPKILN